MKDVADLLYEKLPATDQETFVRGRHRVVVVDDSDSADDSDSSVEILPTPVAPKRARNGSAPSAVSGVRKRNRLTGSQRSSTRALSMSPLARDHPPSASAPRSMNGSTPSAAGGSSPLQSKKRSRHTSTIGGIAAHTTHTAHTHGHTGSATPLEGQQQHPPPGLLPPAMQWSPQPSPQPSSQPSPQPSPSPGGSAYHTDDTDATMPYHTDATDDGTSSPARWRERREHTPMLPAESP